MKMNKLTCELKLRVKTFLMIIAVLCCSSAALSMPTSIIYGINLWIGDDLEFKFALWEGVKLWLPMTAMIIPGGILYLVAKKD